ncbi:MAG: hypothetical protein AABX61_01270 [Nanoarchaeota archaeon]
MLLFTKDKDKIYNLELRETERQEKLLENYKIPNFDFGLEYLKDKTINFKDDKNRFLDSYTKKWFEDPKRFLTSNKKPDVFEKSGFLCFNSILDNSKITKFKYDPQPLGSIGRKVALIHLMHWNGRLDNYSRIINLIRKTILPISTLIHIPAYRGLNPGKDAPADYESVSPNIGKTIFTTRQNIIDLLYITKYLKDYLGYEEVGLFTYSLGSLDGVLTSMIGSKLFDFNIFHLVADNFTEAVMKGIGTKQISKRIKNKIKSSLLNKLWSTISPGVYTKYFNNFSEHTRIVQAKYDLVFNQKNVNNFTKKIYTLRPDIDVNIVPLSHNTLGSFPFGWKVMFDDISFIYKHTKMQDYKRSILFNKNQ